MSISVTSSLSYTWKSDVVELGAEESAEPQRDLAAFRQARTHFA
jgi:hypothetical protein